MTFYRVLFSLWVRESPPASVEPNQGHLTVRKVVLIRMNYSELHITWSCFRKRFIIYSLASKCLEMRNHKERVLFLMFYYPGFLFDDCLMGPDWPYRNGL